MSRVRRPRAIVARLRGPGAARGTARRPVDDAAVLLEETYEVLDAIESGDRARLREELGDLLFQVVMLAQIAAGAGPFAVADVPAGIARQDGRPAPARVRRGGGRVARRMGAAEGVARPRSPRRRAPHAAGAPARAPRRARRRRRSASTGTTQRGCWRRCAKRSRSSRRRRNPVRIEEELGDLLMAVASLGRKLGAPPESALQKANDSIPVAVPHDGATGGRTRRGPLVDGRRRARRTLGRSQTRVGESAR